MSDVAEKPIEETSPAVEVPVAVPVEVPVETAPVAPDFMARIAELEAKVEAADKARQAAEDKAELTTLKAKLTAKGIDGDVADLLIVGLKGKPQSELDKIASKLGVQTKQIAVVSTPASKPTEKKSAREAFIGAFEGLFGK